ncbi:MAG: RNA methyltransferase [Frankiaceae bacterium]
MSAGSAGASGGVSAGSPRLLTNVRAGPVSAARRLAKRGFRTTDRRFLVEGPQGVREALQPTADGSPRLVSLFATSEAGRRHADLLAEGHAAGVEVHLVSGAVIAAIAQTVTPQGLIGVASFLDVPLASVLDAAPRLVVVLAAVRDPGNAGTVLRTADAAGADAVIFSTDSVDCYNGKCVRASAGSLFHLPVVVDAPMAATAAALRAAGLRILAADGTGAVELDGLAAAGGLAAPTAWLFGNEAWGLPDAVLGLAQETVRVPLYGRAESLNLATAAAVCLYASARAQRTGPPPAQR